ncbi:hypothetical protein M426DRAFT_177438 [Hypoxylon sp. CI-4A]|nr:hypothetical protein M426DRAFT_177438 [Hypoxylon sp. CI-4A]
MALWSRLEFRCRFHCSAVNAPHRLSHLVSLAEWSLAFPSVLLPARTPAAPGNALPRGSWPWTRKTVGTPYRDTV